MDISEAGMSFSSGCSVSLGDEVTVAWRMAPEEPPFTVLCVVRYVAERQVGVEFLNLTLGERVRLCSFITTVGADVSE